MVQTKKTVHSTPRVAQKRQSALGGGSAPSADQPTRGPNRSAARSVGLFVPKLTRTAFEKFGFSTAQLLTDWPQIAGAALAEMTCPDRIVWPRVKVQADDGEQSSAPRTGATLHLRVDPARALDVQYKTALLIDRINAYFGYRAVSEIRLSQVRIERNFDAGRLPSASPAKTGSSSAPVPALTEVGDDRLRAALERMQRGLLTRRP